LATRVTVRRRALWAMTAVAVLSVLALGGGLAEAQVPTIEYPDIDIGDDYPGGGGIGTCMECQLVQGLPDQSGNPTYFYRCYKPVGRAYSGKIDCWAGSDGCDGTRCSVFLS
jgi:hypothetical protein